MCVCALVYACVRVNDDHDDHDVNVNRNCAQPSRNVHSDSARWGVFCADILAEVKRVGGTGAGVRWMASSFVGLSNRMVNFSKIKKKYF